MKIVNYTLIEIITEELPLNILKILPIKLKIILKNKLKKNSIEYKNIKIFITLLRMTIIITKIKKNNTQNNLIPQLIKEIIMEIPIKKPMRWGENKQSFIRPIKNICILDSNNNKTIIKLFNLKNNKNPLFYTNKKNKKLLYKIKNYTKIMEIKHKIILNNTKRKNLIKNQIKNLLQKQYKIKIKKELLNTNANLTEYPFVFMGKFNKKHLELPNKILTFIIEKQQNCFTVNDKNNHITNKFMIISKVNKKKNIINENQKSIDLKLLNIKEMIKLDKKINMNNINILKKIIFHKNIGSIHDKIIKIKKISFLINKQLKRKKINIKNILLYFSKKSNSKIIEEYPEIENIILKNKKEIFQIPIKIDNIISMFSLNEIPSGNKDPYGLKKQATELINIILKNKISININKIIKFNIKNFLFIKNKSQLQTNILKFLLERFRNIYKKNNYIDRKLINLININEIKNIYATNKKLLIINKNLHSKEFKNLIQNIKRINNIIKNNKKEKNPIKKKLNISPIEIKIIKIINFQKKESIKSNSIRKIIKFSVNIEKKIKIFFEKIMININKKKIKENRIEILKRTKKILEKYSLLSKI